MEQLLFLREFWKHWREVGSIAPASPFLAARLLSQIEPARANVVVELGAGMGTITRPLLQKLPATSRLVTFEINPTFCATLRTIGDQRLTILERSAADLTQAVVGGQADYIISTLPLCTCGSLLRKKILSAITRTLSPEGVFFQYQYVPAAYPLFKRTFAEVQMAFELLNAPPAFIYRCRRAHPQ